MVHCPGPLILEDRVDGGQLLELLLGLGVLVRVDLHRQLLVLLLDLLGCRVDADVHQLVEGSVNRVNLNVEG